MESTFANKKFDLEMDIERLNEKLRLKEDEFNATVRRCEEKYEEEI